MFGSEDTSTAKGARPSKAPKTTTRPAEYLPDHLFGEALSRTHASNVRIDGVVESRMTSRDAKRKKRKNKPNKDVILG